MIVPEVPSLIVSCASLIIRSFPIVKIKMLAIDIVYNYCGLLVFHVAHEANESMTMR